MTDDKRTKPIIWITSQTEEIFRGEEYESREAAIEGGREEYSGEGFFIGKCKDLDLSCLINGIAQDICERLYEQASEIVGEVVDDWPRISSEHEEEIEAFILQIFENHYRPSFSVVQDVEEIEALEQEEDTK